VVFDEDSMLWEKSETEDKAQGGALYSLATDTQEKGIEFSDSLKRPEVRRGLLKFRWRQIGGYLKAT